MENICQSCGGLSENIKYCNYCVHKYGLSNEESPLTDAEKEIQIENEKFNKSKEYIKIYSNIPEGFKLIEFIESFIVVDTGMWSTSSDNLDAFWGALHDNIARSGSNTPSLIKKGFDDTKELLKREAFIRNGNCVVDLKYNFSELAGNGKILIYAQATAAINPNNKDLSFKTEK